MEINDKSTKALIAALQFRQMRQDLISSNIANAETPGYKAKRLEFENALAMALDSDNEMHMKVNDDGHFNVGGGGLENIAPEVFEDTSKSVSINGNNVDRDEEMAMMAENKIMYDAAIHLLNKKIALKNYLLNSDK